MKLYILIDTYLKELMVCTTKAELIEEYKARKRADSLLGFDMGDHYKLALVRMSQRCTRKEG